MIFQFQNTVRALAISFLLKYSFLSSHAFTPYNIIHNYHHQLSSGEPLQFILSLIRKSTSDKKLYFGGALFGHFESAGDINGDDEKKEEDDEEESLYEQIAASEFEIASPSSLSSPPGQLTSPLTSSEGVDWGGEYDTLRQRASDAKSGRVGPPLSLFRIMTSQSPNEAVSDFVSTADPQVVEAMGGAVQSLLGGLVNPAVGVETIVKASGERLGNLCFQLQMTGYMFRNAEYVLALKDLMNIRGPATLDDYRQAFCKLDTDESGYIESVEVEDLLSDVYKGDIPKYEVEAFLRFFDSNKDGKISWNEFESGLGAISSSDSTGRKFAAAALPGSILEEDDNNDKDDNFNDELSSEPSVSGKVKVELKNGKVIEVEAREYIKKLKEEAEALKDALEQERGRFQQQQQSPVAGMTSDGPSKGGADGIAVYILSLQGNFKSLTEGISSDVVEAMKLLVDYVLASGRNGDNKGKKNITDKKEMEIPGSALQQLALWQLVLGYKLREAEATGDYRKLLED